MDLDKLKSLPRYQVLRSLLSGDIDPIEGMKAFSIHSHEVPLGGDVAAFVYRSRRDHFHVFVSHFLSPEARREVFLHELYHIIEDMPRVGYVLGINFYKEPLEKRADLFMRETAVAFSAE